MPEWRMFFSRSVERKSPASDSLAFLIGASMLNQHKMTKEG